jgi:histidine ammonia-lyase
MPRLPIITLDGRTLTPASVVDIARGRAEARIGTAARERNRAAERLVRGLIDRGELLYGVTTGVGTLRSAPSSGEDPGEHQWRLIRSHAGGGGATLTVEVVRAAMAVRANQLGAGGAGVGDSLLDGLLGALRTGVTPLARELGSLGTGDLTLPRSASRSAARASVGSETTSSPRTRRSPPTASTRSSTDRATASAS